MEERSYKEVLETLERQLADAKRTYLQMFGWKETSQTPNYRWYWTKEFKGSILMFNTDDAVQITKDFIDVDTSGDDNG
jgi:hypothetical protein